MHNHITDSLRHLESVIGGPILPGIITEIAGPPGSGKTQTMLSIIACLLVMNKNSSLVLILTKASSVIDRLHKILVSNRIDPDVLDRLLLIKTLNRVKAVAQTKRLLAKNRMRLSGIFILAVPDLFDTPGEDPIKLARQVFRLVYPLKKLAFEKDCPLVCTNNLGVNGKLALGSTFSSLVGERLYIDKDRHLTVSHSQRVNLRRVSIIITDQGVEILDSH